MQKLTVDFPVEVCWLQWLPSVLLWRQMDGREPKIHPVISDEGERGGKKGGREEGREGGGRRGWKEGRRKGVKEEGREGGSKGRKGVIKGGR